jgi:ATP-dependent helicase HrpB
MISLPIDEYKESIQNAIKNVDLLLLKAEPGAGKTTRVPLFALELGFEQIFVVQPRRLAAVSPAQMLMSQLGNQVGYHIRFDNHTSPQTKIRFCTDGIFLNYLQNLDFHSKKILVILDEFHERRANSDLAYMLVSFLQSKGVPWKLILMSATLELTSQNLKSVSHEILECQGRTFPVEQIYEDYGGTQELEKKVLKAVLKLQKLNQDGHILVFLPGMTSIKKNMEYLEPALKGTDFQLRVLHGEMSLEDQQKVFKEVHGRKIILSTNVAETSVTIPNVQVVVDSGLARIAKINPWTGVDHLEEQPTSQASCIQRAGRAGRTAPGICIRLFSHNDFRSRPPKIEAELTRLDPVSSLLNAQYIANLNFNELLLLPWIENPSPEKWTAAKSLLLQLEAISVDGTLTELGAQMAKLPFHPRISRSVLKAQELGVLSIAMHCASILLEEGIFISGFESGEIDSSDLAFQLEVLFHSDRRAKYRNVLRHDAIHRIQKMAAQGLAVLGQKMAPLEFQDKNWKSKLSKAFLEGFKDRVGKFSKLGGSDHLREFVFCTEGAGTLSASSVVQDDTFLLALQMEKTSHKPLHKPTNLILLAIGIDSSDLLTVDPFIQESTKVVFEESVQKFKKYGVLQYGKLELSVSSTPLSQGELQEMIVEKLKKEWPNPFSEDSWHRTFTRVQLINTLFPQLLSDNPLEGMEFELFLVSISESVENYHQISQNHLWHFLSNYLGYQVSKEINELLPESATLKNGRTFHPDYQLPNRVILRGKIQDFYGLEQLPTLAQGYLTASVELLSPRSHVVQVTGDLAGFWKNTYPSVKAELSRDYPKHFWPADPVTASPPEPRKRR